MFRSFRLKTAHLAASESGSVVIFFATALFSLLLFVGLALDYSRAATLKDKLQIATDAGLIAAANSARSGTPAGLAQATSDLNSYIKTAVPGAEVGAPVFSDGQTSVCVSATANYETVLMRMVGVTTIPVNSYGCTRYSVLTFEIALVLDTSGSMADTANNGQSKMQAAKEAAASLVTTMTAPGAAGSVAFSVVPFTSAVNVGPDHANASFMDTNGQSSIHWANFIRPAGAPYQPASKFALLAGIGTAWGGCVEERPLPHMTTDIAASAAQPDTLFVPFLYPDGKDSGTIINHYLADNGGSCRANDVYDLMDRVAPGRNDAQSKVCKYNGQTPLVRNSGFGATFPAGPNLLCTSLPLTTLTKNISTVNSAISALTAIGGTNLLSGVMWGWRTISPNGPFNTQVESETGLQNAKPYGYISPSQAVNRKVIILLTDGMNTWNTLTDTNGSSYMPFGFFWNNRFGGAVTAANAVDHMNTGTLSACTNAKAAGVIVYTVGFTAQPGDITADGLTLLQNCATQPSYSYIAQNGTELVQAFQAIAGSMSNLRRER